MNTYLRARTTKPKKPHTHRHDLNFVLLPDADQQARLRLTVETYNRARQYVSDAVHELGTLNEGRVRAHIYPALRSVYGLPLAIAAHVVSTVIDARVLEIHGGNGRTYRSGQGRLTHTGIPKTVIPANAPVPYGDGMIAFPTADTVSLWCLDEHGDGREVVPARLLFYEPALHAPKATVAELKDDTEQNVLFLHYFASAGAVEALGLQVP